MVPYLIMGLYTDTVHTRDWRRTLPETKVIQGKRKGDPATEEGRETNFISLTLLSQEKDKSYNFTERL